MDQIETLHFLAANENRFEDSMRPAIDQMVEQGLLRLVDDEHAVLSDACILMLQIRELTEH